MKAKPKKEEWKSFNRNKVIEFYIKMKIENSKIVKY
jgi:hypothetical protein